MSKKITFEEVKEAIDKHTWLTGKLADWSGNDWADLEEEYDFIKNENIIIKYIYQQEKLLELYKEALKTNFEGITLIKLVNKTLRTQIKELENDK